MDTLDLLNEKRKLFKRIDEINKALGIKETRQLSIEDLGAKVKEFTGIEIKGIGRKGNRDVKTAKKLFWRAGFNESLSGTLLSAYTGDKSRFAAAMGRVYHKKNCTYEPMMQMQWEEFKKFIKS